MRCPLDKRLSALFRPQSRAGRHSRYLTQRESPGDRGYFLLLLSPSDPDESQPAPRDLVLVVDTSSSMDEEKLRQAKRALNTHSARSRPDDRFALISFRHHADRVPRRLLCTPRKTTWSRPANGSMRSKQPAEPTSRQRSRRRSAFRGSKQSERTFQVLFLTDGLPTVGLQGIIRNPQDSRSPRLRAESAFTRSESATTSMRTCSICWPKRLPAPAPTFARVKTWKRRCRRSRTRSAARFAPT